MLTSLQITAASILRTGSLPPTRPKCLVLSRTSRDRKDDVPEAPLAHMTSQEGNELAADDEHPEGEAD